MSLTIITSDGKNYAVAAAQLDSVADKFVIQGSRDNIRENREIVCSIRIPLAVPRTDRNYAEYGVALFTHRNWPESQVFSLKEGDASVGLIFSMQALGSGSNVLLTKAMWNEYGFIALSKLCIGDTLFHCKFSDCVQGESYDITELYTEDTVVAVFMKSACGLGIDSESEFLEYVLDRLPGFVPMGLFLQIEEGSTRVRRSVTNDLLSQLAQDHSNIRLQRCGPDFPISSKQFLTDLLLLIDPYEDHPVFRFFLYYQVIESLLEGMFEQGNWLSLEQSSEVLSRAQGERVREKRDYAMLALLFGCGLRRSELVGLEMSDVQTRQGHWAIVGFGWQGRTHSHCPDTAMGEAGAGRVDDGRGDQGWKDFSSRQQDGQGVGRWYLAKRSLVCGQVVLREGGTGTDRAA